MCVSRAHAGVGAGAVAGASGIASSWTGAAAGTSWTGAGICGPGTYGTDEAGAGAGHARELAGALGLGSSTLGLGSSTLGLGSLTLGWALAGDSLEWLIGAEGMSVTEEKLVWPSAMPAPALP